MSRKRDFFNIKDGDKEWLEARAEAQALLKNDEKCAKSTVPKLKNLKLITKSDYLNKVVSKDILCDESHSLADNELNGEWYPKPSLPDDVKRPDAYTLVGLKKMCVNAAPDDKKCKGTKADIYQYLRELTNQPRSQAIDKMIL